MTDITASVNLNGNLQKDVSSQVDIATAIAYKTKSLRNQAKFLSKPIV